MQVSLLICITIETSNDFFFFLCVIGACEPCMRCVVVVAYKDSSVRVRETRRRDIVTAAGQPIKHFSLNTHAAYSSVCTVC